MPESEKAIPSLDGLRAVSIILVIIGHATTPSSFLEKLLMRHAGLGVAMFFVISGFLITTLLLRERKRFGKISLSLFYARRALRILPAFALFVGVVSILNAFSVITLPPHDLLYVLTYTVNFNPRPAWWTGHLWSLSVEEQFYLLWPLTLYFTKPKTWIFLATGAVFANIGMGVFHRVFGVRLFGLDPSVYYFALPFVCAPIAIGCLLALKQEEFKRWVVPLLNGRMGLMLFPAVILVDTVAREPLGLAFRDALLGLCVVRFVFCPTRAEGKALNYGAIKLVGKLSYSLYLWQQLFMGTNSTNHLSLLPILPLNVLATFAAATASYVLVEAPLMGLRSRLRRASQYPSAMVTS